MKAAREIVLSQLFWAALIFALITFRAYGHLSTQKATHEEFLAQKTLLTNHRLVDGDVAEAGWPHRFFSPTLTTRDDFTGRYVAACVENDYALTLGATLSGPDLVTRPNMAIVWIPLAGLPSSDVATIDVGRKLDVCNIHGNDGCDRYTVEAIACDGKELTAATCSAAVQMRNDDRAAVLKMLDKADRAAKKDPTRIHVFVYRPDHPRVAAAQVTPSPRPPGTGTPAPQPSPKLCPPPQPATPTSKPGKNSSGKRQRT